ncbi:hypothetical protein BHF72_0898 [Cloacibacterium normanense]|uniref:Uncharacterized protein n=1 Tax=Cloacibacterium normanense TaxID=237258 RepID=A0A1E5UB98_9FLAO|nr:hypothetical protein BHF72_0898 [Cloacibacterium normanense]
MIGDKSYYQRGNKHHHESKTDHNPTPAPQFFPRSRPGSFIQKWRQEYKKYQFRFYMNFGRAGNETDAQTGQDQQNRICNFYFFGEHHQQHGDDHQDQVKCEVLKHLVFRF